MKTPKIRLDTLLLQRNLAPDLRTAQSWIMTGNVLVQDRPITKPGTLMATTVPIRIKHQQAAYASRGGVKLSGALRHFNLSIHHRIAMDVGASTGGFTDCLLQHGAQRVYAVDVGYGLLAWELRCDPRVISLERTHIAHLDPTQIPDPIDVMTLDVSFISLTKVLPALPPFLNANADIIALVKPQFEAPPEDVAQGGVIRDPAVRQTAIQRVLNRATELGFSIKDGIDSSLPGPKGNVEFLVWLQLHAL